MTDDQFPDIGLNPDYPLATATEYNVVASKLGDGYEDRRPDGINNRRYRWTLTYSQLDKEQHDTLFDFLDSRQQVYSFLWIHPITSEAHTVLCEDFSSTYASFSRYMLQISLKEVHE